MQRGYLGKVGISIMAIRYVLEMQAGYLGKVGMSIMGIRYTLIFLCFFVQLFVRWCWSEDALLSVTTNLKGLHRLPVILFMHKHLSPMCHDNLVERLWSWQGPEAMTIHVYTIESTRGIPC